jgi:phosphoribosylformylglycinamidine cyclo-ligase
VARLGARFAEKLVAGKLTYRGAGVNIDLKQRLIPIFRRLAKPTLGAEVIEGVGGFGGLVSLQDVRRMRSPVMVSGTDSVGTKLKIAFLTGRHDSVGIDCVAMCVNDIICHGAKPLFFLDYIATGKLDGRVAAAIVKGVARGCEQAGSSLVGGETAQLPGLYRPGEYDLVGFAAGVVERERIPVPARMRAGNVLVGLASSGLHSNGFSLARKVLLERAKLKLDGFVPELKRTLADELLRPTRIYAKVVVEMFERFTIRGLANITGGGVIENLPRVMPARLRALIKRGTWPRSPIFDLIARLGRVDQAEMDRTFNNGLGMVAVVAENEADGALAYLQRNRQPAYIIGEVARGERGVSFV